MDLKVSVKPRALRSFEQHQYLNELLDTPFLYLEGGEYVANNGWTVWALQETGLLAQDRVEPYIVEVMEGYDRSREQDQVIVDLISCQRIAKILNYDEPRDWYGPVYNPDRNLYALATPDTYYLLKSNDLLVETMTAEPRKPATVPSEPANFLYTHDNEFFQPYNIEVSSADAPTFTNDQGGRQSYQPGAFELLPPIALTEVAKVLEHGAAKYEAWNWTAIPSHMHLRSCMGHLFSFISGDVTEGGDRYHHLTHAATRLLFAVEMYARETGRFDKA